MTITRTEVARRSTAVPWEPYTVEYDQAPVLPDFPHGADCSAYVAFCWGITDDVNTETLVSGGYMRPIEWDDLRPGDAVGHCGPNTAGNAGHVVLFVAWLNQDPSDNRFYCRQQNGDGPGPRYDLVDPPIGYYRPYRFVDIVDDEPTPVVVPTPGPDVETPRFVTVVAYTDDSPPWNSTLSGIAEHEGTTVEQLLALNPNISNPDLIYPNQSVRVA